MLGQINSFLEHWEPTWLLLVLLAETGVSLVMLYWIILEYRYDAEKDLAKKQRRTKTTKKTTRNPGGIEITEESSEVVEPTGETNEETKA